MVLRYVLKKYNKGILTSIYLIWYGIGRVYIESLRTDSLMLGNIKVAQLISILSIIIGIVILVISIIRTNKESKIEKEEVKEIKKKKSKKTK
jgi:phosphatidylglycerol:prolipoprotein diacylglycerol transferase